MIKKKELKLSNGKVLSFETGLLATQAGGAVVVRMGDTMVLATATASRNMRPGIDFFPLTVDFEEKFYAAGKIPGGYFKREGKATEKAVLTSRLIDRPIRPMFPKGYRNDVQIVVTPMAVDFETPPDILAINGASAALAISDIPMESPIAAVRVTKIGSEFKVNPTEAEIASGEMDLVVAGRKDAILMLEAGAKQVREADMVKALSTAMPEINAIIDAINAFAKEAGKKKSNPDLYHVNEDLEKFILKEYEGKLKKAMTIAKKEEQMEELASIEKEILEKAKESKDEKVKAAAEKSPADIKEISAGIQKKAVRQMIVKDKKRPDGRGLKDIRQLDAQIGLVPRAHGTGLFSRGHTQVLTYTTLGSAGEEQSIEGLGKEETVKRYMHHYNFPPFSVGEVKPMRGPGRREIGHGALAERALIPVLPSQDEFPYTIRLVSEVLGSNGSTSMASTCASTLSLMDAGVPISAPVGGISVGLITEDNQSITITDIQGIEDFYGDMDFKVTGTRKGITAIQLDLKLKAGLSVDLTKKILDQALEGRMIILDKMDSVIKAPKKELSEFAPRVVTLKINPEKIGFVIGPGGKNIKAIIAESGAQVDIDDSGTVFITSNDPKGMEIAKKRIEDMTFEPKVGDVYTGKVTRLMNFGAFVEFAPGKEGLVHISQLAKERVNKVEDVVKVGDTIAVKLVEIDDMGRLNLSHKATL